MACYEGARLVLCETIDVALPWEAQRSNCHGGSDVTLTVALSLLSASRGFSEGQLTIREVTQGQVTQDQVTKSSFTKGQCNGHARGSKASLRHSVTLYW